MTYRVPDGFFRDPFQFLFHQRMKRARRSLLCEHEARSFPRYMRGRPLSQCIGKSGSSSLEAQLFNAITAFNQNLLRALQRGVEQLTRRVGFRQLVGDCLELQQQSLKALQQRVVELACDPFPLCYPDVDTGSEPGRSPGVLERHKQRPSLQPGSGPQEV